MKYLKTTLSNAGTIGPQIEALGVPVITLGMSVGNPALAGVLKLRRVIKELQPDLIQGWMYHGNLAATLAQSLLTKKLHWFGMFANLSCKIIPEQYLEAVFYSN